MIIKDAALRFGLFNSVPSRLVSLPRDKDGDPTRCLQNHFSEKTEAAVFLADRPSPIWAEAPPTPSDRLNKIARLLTRVPQGA